MNKKNFEKEMERMLDKLSIENSPITIEDEYGDYTARGYQLIFNVGKDASYTPESFFEMIYDKAWESVHEENFKLKKEVEKLNKLLEKERIADRKAYKELADYANQINKKYQEVKNKTISKNKIRVINKDGKIQLVDK